MSRTLLVKTDEALQAALGRICRAEEAAAESDDAFARGQASGLCRARRELKRTVELLGYALDDEAYTDALAAREEAEVARERGAVAYYGPEALQAFAAELAETDHD
jgi:hypothetical protein